MSLTVGEVIAAYLKLRAKKDAIDNEAKERTKELKAKMEKLEAWLKVKADEEGVSSFKTTNGTAFLTTVDYANVADWDSTLEFIRGREAFDLLEKRVSKTAVRSYIENDKMVPPGINYGTKVEVNIRKPAASAD